MVTGLPAPGGAGADQGGAGPLSIVSSSLSDTLLLLAQPAAQTPHRETETNVLGTCVAFSTYRVLTKQHRWSLDTPWAWRHMPRYLAEMQPLGPATPPSPRPPPTTGGRTCSIGVVGSVLFRTIAMFWGFLGGMCRVSAVRVKFISVHVIRGGRAHTYPASAFGPGCGLQACQSELRQAVNCCRAVICPAPTHPSRLLPRAQPAWPPRHNGPVGPRVPRQASSSVRSVRSNDPWQCDPLKQTSTSASAEKEIVRQVLHGPTTAAVAVCVARIHCPALPRIRR